MMQRRKFNTYNDLLTDYYMEMRKSLASWPLDEAEREILEVLAERQTDDREWRVADVLLNSAIVH